VVHIFDPWLLLLLLQMLFMCYAFGGAEAWKGKSMYEAHKGMGLTEEHFNAVAGHFIATLKVGRSSIT